MDKVIKECNIRIMEDALKLLNVLLIDHCLRTGHLLDPEVAEAYKEAWQEIKATYLDSVECGP